MISHIKTLWCYLSKHHKKNFFLIFVLMIAVSIAEVVSIGAVLPFIGVLSSPEVVYQHELMLPIIQLLDLNSADQLLFPITAGFIAAVLIAGIMRIVLLYAINHFERVVGSRLNEDIFCRVLYQEYSQHIGRNSSYIIALITKKTDVVIRGILRSILTLISSILILFGIVSMLILVNIEIAFSAFVGFSFIYWSVHRYTRKRRSVNSQNIANEHAKMIKTLQEGMGGIRDVLINGSQQFYCAIFHKSDIRLRYAIADNDFIAFSPRFAIEALGITLMAILAYYMSQKEGGIVSVIPALGVMVMGVQRLLPALQTIYGSISTIHSSRHSLRDVLDLLKQPLQFYARQTQVVPMLLKKEIRLNNISFRYGVDTSLVLDKVNIVIAKGSRVGFIGATGSGKSTLLDIIMGLISPTKGTLEVDGIVITGSNIRNWQANIAHVSQDIYLSDSTIEENIAFGEQKNNIDFDLVKESAKSASIAETIEDWPNKYQTIVGERGVRLSGGQIQRIGIARALYRRANILIFDEATSALDSRTEKSIINSINKTYNDTTILMIAHRITTLKDCNQIIELDDGIVSRIGSYNDLCS
jgi:ATP-binding cassette, subfamily B, bacterial PglK